MSVPKRPAPIRIRRAGKSMAKRILDATGVGPFSGMRMKPAARRIPKLADPTAPLPKKLMRSPRSKVR